MFYPKKSNKTPNGAYVPPMPTRVPMPQIEPSCKHRISLVCNAEDDIWNILLGDKHICYANSKTELVSKLNNLLEIID